MPPPLLVAEMPNDRLFRVEAALYKITEDQTTTARPPSPLTDMKYLNHLCYLGDISCRRHLHGAGITHVKDDGEPEAVPPGLARHLVDPEDVYLQYPEE